MPTVEKSRRLRLLPHKSLIKTNDVDHADWNYKPFIGTIQRLRFRLIRELLGDERYGRLLEIGYGSGVFMPELAARCDELFGIDPHPRDMDVQNMLKEHSVISTLRSAGAGSIPFGDSFFDCAVAVSALEFIPDLNRACEEVLRVLKPDGVFVIVTPGQSPMLDLGLKILTGKSAKKDFDNRREVILPTLLQHFRVLKRIDHPPFIGRGIRLYTALRLVRK